MPTGALSICSFASSGSDKRSCPFIFWQEVNEEWISDKARFSYDGLKRQRLNEPLIRNSEGQLEPVTWAKALKTVAEAALKVNPAQMAAIAGKLSDAESMMALKDLMNRLGCERLWVEGNGEDTVADLRSNYLVNSTIAGLENTDACLLIGTEVRLGRLPCRNCCQP